MPKEQDGTFHGGFVRNRGENRGVRIARAKANELPKVNPDEAQERIEELQKDATFPLKRSNPMKARKPDLTTINLSKGLVKRGMGNPEGTEAKPRSTKLACLGIPASVLDEGSPEYARCVRLANSYKKARTKELYIAHGYVSSGVAALLAASSLALSASRFLYETAANTELQPSEKGHLGMPQMLKLASSLSDSARQNELSAWELCAREAVIRKRNENSDKALPWVITASGAEVKKSGRPRNNRFEGLVIETESGPTPVIIEGQELTENSNA